MALERYQGGATPFQQTSSVGYQAQAQTTGALTDRLEEWNYRAFEIAKKDVQEKGQEQAINDMVSGNPLKMEKGYSFYAEAYNDVSKAAYNIQVESDLKRKAEELQAQDPLNPQKFNEVFDAYSKASINKIEEPKFKAIYMQQAYKIGATYSNNMTKNAYENSLKNSIEVINAGITDTANNYYASFANGDVEGATHGLASYTAMLDAKVKAGEMDERLIPYELQKLQKGAIRNKALLELDNSINAGETDYIDKFMSSETYKKMTFEERKEIVKAMHEHTDTSYKALTDASEGADKMLKAVSKKTSIDLYKRVYRGEDVKDTELIDLINEGKLDPKDMRDIMQDASDMRAGSLTDDSQAVTNYELNIESINPRIIARDSRLTSKTKQRLISKVISHQETVKGNKALADAFKNQRNMLGKTSWQMSVEYLNSNVFDDDIDREKQIRNNLLNQVRDEVEQGKVNPLNAHERTQELVDKWQKTNKDKSDSSKYDRQLKEYNDKLKIYNESKTSTWGKLKEKIGSSTNPPVAPKRPDNYIPKSQR